MTRMKLRAKGVLLQQVALAGCVVGDATQQQARLHQLASPALLPAHGAMSA